MRFKVGLGISRTNADSQWNSVYEVFHRFFVVETKRFVDSTLNVIFGCVLQCVAVCCSVLQLVAVCYIEAANLRPALEVGSGKQTPSARK